MGECCRKNKNVIIVIVMVFLVIIMLLGLLYWKFFMVPEHPAGYGGYPPPQYQYPPPPNPSEAEPDSGVPFSNYDGWDAFYNYD